MAHLSFSTIGLGRRLYPLANVTVTSPSFGQWTGSILSGENRRQLFIPKGFAHGFCVLSETADVMYKCTDFYMPEDEHGIYWADPLLNIIWPIEDPILSEKDEKNPEFKNIPEDHLPPYQGHVATKKNGTGCDDE